MAKRYYLQSAVSGNPGKFTIDGDLTDVFKGYDSLTGLPATSFEVEATSGFNGTYTVLGSIYNGGTNRTEITISAVLATGAAAFCAAGAAAAAGVAVAVTGAGAGVAVSWHGEISTKSTSEIFINR